MKQFLRSFLTLLMLVVWASGFAADKTYSYTFKSKGTFTEKNQTKTFNSVNWTISTDAGYLAFNKNQGAQQIGSKSNPGKNTTISTSDFSGTIKSVKINGWNSNDAAAKVEILVGEISYGSQSFTKKSNDYNYTGTSTGTVSIKIANNAGAFYIKTISVTYEEGPTKTPTTLTFQKSIFNIEEGNEATFTGQTAKLKADGTELNNAITYTTNNDAMFETYEANVGPKALKASAYGTAIVTAKFNGDDTYEASTATYTVNYTEKEKPATTLDFGFATKTVNIDETFTAAATLKSGETAIKGAVTYSSYKPEVAYVDEATGEVLALTAGKTTITATFAGTSEYKSSTASYELTVVDPNATETSTTFDFTKPEKYNYGITKTNDNGGTPAFGKGEGDVTLNKTIVSDDVTITNTKVDGYGTRFWNNTDLRVYSDNEHVVSVPDGYYITSIVIKATDQSKYAKYQIGDNEVGTDWTGNAQSVTITYTGNSRLTSMKVTYTKPSYKTLPLNETTTAEDAKVLLKANLNKTVNVTINRTLVANKWNTLCLPFDVTAEQIKNILKAEGMVREYKDQTADCINFQAAETMTAGVPYLIKPTEEVKGLTFEGVKITATAGVAKGAEAGSTDENLSICGVLGAKALSTDGSELFLNAAGKFVAPAEGKQTMRGFRAYFMSMLGAGAKINIDGETTGINSIETEAAVNGKVYNLNGQYVGNSLNGLKKGIYVVNGKKVIK